MVAVTDVTGKRNLQNSCDECYCLCGLDQNKGVLFENTRDSTQNKSHVHPKLLFFCKEKSTCLNIYDRLVEVKLKK